MKQASMEFHLKPKLSLSHIRVHIKKVPDLKVEILFTLHFSHGFTSRNHLLKTWRGSK